MVNFQLLQYLKLFLQLFSEVQLVLLVMEAFSVTMVWNPHQMLYWK